VTFYQCAFLVMCR